MTTAFSCPALMATKMFTMQCLFRTKCRTVFSSRLVLYHSISSSLASHIRTVLNVSLELKRPINIYRNRMLPSIHEIIHIVDKSHIHTKSFENWVFAQNVWESTMNINGYFLVQKTFLNIFPRLFTSHPAMYGVFPFAKGYGSWP